MRGKSFSTVRKSIIGEGGPAALALGAVFAVSAGAVGASGQISQDPLFLSQGIKPLTMLALSNDHQLYFEAYPEYADLDGDGTMNQTYTHGFEYYGYFDSYKCYDYSGSNNRFEPRGETEDRYCNGVNGDWSGNFLNWVSMSRMDVVRKILFGGHRVSDTVDQTVLERAFIPTDGHSWVRFYDGDDLDDLTPFSNQSEPAFHSTSSVTLGTGSRVFESSDFNSGDKVQFGDQVQIDARGQGLDYEMRGVVISQNNANGDITVEVTSFIGPEGETHQSWDIVNPTRTGVTFCNATYASGGASQDVSEPPLIRAARGNYSLWVSNERWQCQWWEDHRETGHSSMTVGTHGWEFSNGNDVSMTGLFANGDNPQQSEVGLGRGDYVARVEVCNNAFASEGEFSGDEKDDCREYQDDNFKPIGLLQQFGDTDQIHFGLLSGSYDRNKSGGVLRKNIASIQDEIDSETGQFSSDASDGAIIDTLNRFRIYGYDYGRGRYNDFDNCPWGMSDFNDGQCTNWGNPQSEIMLEAIRYFANSDSSPLSATSAFDVGSDDKIDGIGSADWEVVQDDANYCAATSVINFNSSVASYDADQLNSASDLPGSPNLNTWTDLIGAEEGIHGDDWFVGRTSGDANELCTSKTVGSLSAVRGLCPEAPRLEGGYHAAGLSHYAYTEDLRPDLQSEQHATTYAVALAPAVPRIDVPVRGGGDTAARILPACLNNTVGGNCAIMDFRMVEQDIDAGTGKFFVNWEDSEQGGDFDMDMVGILEYRLRDGTIEITTQATADSTPNRMGFGYVISGTGNDGFYAHSGINDFSYNNPIAGAETCSSCSTGEAPTTNSLVLSAAGPDGGLLEPPMWYAAKWGGYDRNGNFPEDTDSWDASGDGNPDNYYFAVDPSELADDLEQVFGNIVEDDASATAVVANSTRLDTDTAVYQGAFNSERWSGDLRAFSVDVDDASVADSFQWSAADRLDSRVEDFTHSDRNIVAGDLWEAGERLVSSAREFKWGSLSQGQRDLLIAGDDDDDIGSTRLAYLRGDRSNEQSAASPDAQFRQRDSIMGDVVNSDPQFFHRENFGYSVLEASFSGMGDGSYSAHRDSIASRPPVVLVGANDGMLHAFNAEVEGEDAGKELFSYIPAGVFENLHELTDENYSHRFYVDGTPRVADAWLGSDDGWVTMAVGSTGAGGHSVFALDVTEPTSMGPDDFMWEFTHEDMGKTIQQPAIVGLANEQFGVVVTSGYHDDNPPEDGKIWILDAADGSEIREIEIEGSGELGSPLVVDLTGNRVADRIYVGDTDGQLWRVDINQADESDWGIPDELSQGNTEHPLFTAAEDQPITARLSSAFNPEGDHMVFFGTGSFFRTGDNVVTEDPAVQSFYGIVDRGERLERDDLDSQYILGEVDEPGGRFRAVSDNEPEEDPFNGWYIDLVSPEHGKQGERVTARTLVRGDRVIFPTLIPSDDPCAGGGSSWLMEVDMFTGGRLPYSVFDVNNDGTFDEDDFIEIDVEGETVEVPASGMGSEVGIINTPTVLEDVGPGGDEAKVVSGSSGQMMTIQEAGSRTRGRQSWEQLH